MIEISQLKVEKQSQTICQIAELQVQPGETLAVIGSNGSGKTTLMRVLAGLEQSYSGQCKVGIHYLERTYLHQQPLLFRGTVLGNVHYAWRSEQEPIDWLRKLGVDHLAQRTTLNLSGGETRRTALARALATGAKLLLLDEPLADLDPQATEKVCQTLAELEDTTIVISSPTPLPEQLSAREVFLS